MKKSILYLFLILAQGLNAQEVLKTTLHSRHSSHDHKRIIKSTPKEGIYSFTEIWKDGTLKREGFVTEYEPKFKQTGREITYHKNGQISMIQFVSYAEIKRSGTIKVGNGERENVQYTTHETRRVGNIKMFYENGKLKEEGKFLIPTLYLNSNHQKFKYPNYVVIQIADSLGNTFLDSLGSGKVNITYANGNIIEGEYVKGLKNGQHKEFHAKQKYTYMENYKTGKFLRGKYIDSLGEKTNYKEGQLNPRTNLKRKFQFEPYL